MSTSTLSLLRIHLSTYTVPWSKDIHHILPAYLQCYKAKKTIFHIWNPKHILKIKSARIKVEEFFFLTIQALFLPWTMTENYCGAQYQPCRDVIFLSFDSDCRLPSTFVRWYGYKLTTKNRGPLRVAPFDSEGLSYSTKVPSDLFSTYRKCLKKTHGAKENDSRPGRTWKTWAP